MQPNTGIVSVPDDRLQALATLSKTDASNIVPTTVEYVDIAGLVKCVSPESVLILTLYDQHSPCQNTGHKGHPARYADTGKECAHLQGRQQRGRPRESVPSKYTGV